MQYGQWIGRAALALIFLFNALGVVDQTRPANELAAHGAPAALVATLIAGGRASACRRDCGATLRHKICSCSGEVPLSPLRNQWVAEEQVTCQQDGHVPN